MLLKVNRNKNLTVSHHITKTGIHVKRLILHCQLDTYFTIIAITSVYELCLFPLSRGVDALSSFYSDVRVYGKDLYQSLYFSL